MINVALAGTWHVHFEGYADTVAKKENCHITALWDPCEEDGKRFAEKYHCDFESDYAHMLARDDVDAVLVCSQTSLHPEIIIQAANAGKHIFTEKVLCFDVKTAEKVAEAVKKAGVEFCISFPFRTNSDMLWVKDALDRGLVGEVNYCRVRNVHNGAIAGWLPDTFYDAKTCGGGAMMDLGAHPMYLLNWFMGKPKAVSSAFTNCVVQSVEDNAVSLLEYENGAIGVSETAFVSPSPFSLEISGLKGTILAGGADHTVRYNIGDGWVVPALPERLPQPIDAWIDAIETGVSVPYSIDDAVALTQIMEAAYIASNERRKVMIL